jgi:hypothetical protein
MTPPAASASDDPFFLNAGAEAFKRDVPDTEVHFLDTGHFAPQTIVICDSCVAAHQVRRYRAASASRRNPRGRRGRSTLTAINRP